VIPFVTLDDYTNGKIAPILANPKAYIGDVITKPFEATTLRIDLDPVKEKQAILGHTIETQTQGHICLLTIPEAKKLTAAGFKLPCKPGLEEQVTLALSKQE